jgi:acetylornithine/N-succinyldiaminopimelate aminotransferase
MGGEAAQPDIMRRQALEAASGRAMPGDRTRGEGMTVGVHGYHLRGNPLAMAVGIAAFDEIKPP